MQTSDPERSRSGSKACTRASRSGSHEARRNRWRALASLLADDSPAVLDTVRQEFESGGRAGVPALVRATRAESPRVRGRARTLLLDRAKTRALRRLLGYVASHAIDLEKALFLLARYHDPGVDPRPWSARLDVLAREVRLRTREQSDPLERGQILVDYLASEVGLSGAKGEFHHPDNVHVHRVLERRRGIPLSLCAAYMFVARRAGIRAACVPMQGFVLLRISGDGKSRLVDPYNRGRLRTERECREQLRQLGRPVRNASFREADDATLLRRQIANLMHSADLRGLPRERRELVLVGRALELAHAKVAAPRGT